MSLFSVRKYVIFVQAWACLSFSLQISDKYLKLKNLWAEVGSQTARATKCQKQSKLANQKTKQSKQTAFLLVYSLQFHLANLLKIFLTIYRAFYLSSLLTVLLAYLLTRFLAYLLAFFLASLLEKFPGILPDISPGVFSHIFWHPFWLSTCSIWHTFWHLFSASSDILSASLSGVSRQSFGHLWWKSFWRVAVLKGFWFILVYIGSIGSNFFWNMTAIKITSQHRQTCSWFFQNCKEVLKNEIVVF